MALLPSNREDLPWTFVTIMPWESMSQSINWWGDMKPLEITDRCKNKLKLSHTSHTSNWARKLCPSCHLLLQSSPVALSSPPNLCTYPLPFSLPLPFYAWNIYLATKVCKKGGRVGEKLGFTWIPCCTVKREWVVFGEKSGKAWKVQTSGVISWQHTIKTVQSMEYQTLNSMHIRDTFVNYWIWH